MYCENKLLKKVLCLVIAFVMGITLMPTTNVQAARKKGWVKEGGYKYYYVKGKKATGFKVINCKTYYFAKKGHANLPKGATVKGWYKIGGEYFYFDRVYGNMEYNKKVDGIQLTESGEADKTKYAVKKIKLMIRARKLVQSITKTTDSKKTKRKKVFTYMTKIPYIGYHFLKNVRNRKDWDILMANDILDDKAHDTNGGECTAMACALGYLLHECRYETVYITDDDSTLCGDAHSWVEIDGKAFDPLFARTKGWSNYYNANYNHNGHGANLWAINRRNVSTGKDQ